MVTAIVRYSVHKYRIAYINIRIEDVITFSHIHPILRRSRYLLPVTLDPVQVNVILGQRGQIQARIYPVLHTATVSRKNHLVTNCKNRAINPVVFFKSWVIETVM